MFLYLALPYFVSAFQQYNFSIFCVCVKFMYYFFELEMLLTTKKGEEAIIKDLTAYQAALEAQSAMRKMLLTAKGRTRKLLKM
jgi:hypothetical protein